MVFLDFLFKKQKRPGYLYERLSLSSSDRSKIEEEWSRVEELVKLGGPSQLRQAIIKADNVLDAALSKLTTGTTAGERLRNARPYFKDHTIYQGLWEAHKVRNALVHEADYEPPHYVVEDAIARTKRGLEVIGVRFSNPKGSQVSTTA